MARYGMALDTLTCIGCYACTLACKVENGSPAGIWLAPVIEKEFGAFPDVRRMFLPLLCNHCADAPCINACPTTAITRRGDGIVEIDQDICCGSQACVIACPYGAIHYYDRPDDLTTPFESAKVGHHQPGTAQKCNFCADRLDRGLQPACVDVCPTGARIFGDLEDPDSPLAKALDERPSVNLGSPVNTSPATRYLSDGARQAGGTDADIALPYRRQQHWGLAQAITFWLLGAGAGLFAVSRWLSPNRTVAGLELGATLALLLIAVAGLVLSAHLGKPSRSLRALTNWRANWLSRGATADLLFIPLLALLALPLSGIAAAVITVVALALALVVATYPALAMGAMPAVPNWHGKRLALEYLVESLVAGTALAGILSGWDAPTLSLLIALAVLRILLAIRCRRLSSALAWRATLGSGIAGALAVLALAIPSAVTVLGAGAAVAALATCLLTKVANLNLGTSPSPFDAMGNLGSFGDAER